MQRDDGQAVCAHAGEIVRHARGDEQIAALLQGVGLAAIDAAAGEIGFVAAGLALQVPPMIMVPEPPTTSTNSSSFSWIEAGVGLARNSTNAR
jgi:hypothetical protein